MASVSIVNAFLHRPPGDGPTACVPLGPLYLTSMLEANRIDTELADFQLAALPNPYDPTAVAGFLMSTKGDVLGISTMTNMLPFLLPALTIVKAEQPSRFVVLGGSGASGVAGPLLTRFPQVDAVCRGEGEHVMVEVVEALDGRRDWCSIAGLSYRDATGTMSNPERPRNRELDRLPRPAYHRLDLARYVHLPVLTARGCPYRCDFCDIAPNWDRKVAMRQVSEVLSEIEWLVKEHGSEEITILDDTFCLNPARVRAFCRSLLDAHLPVAWSAMCRVDLIDEGLMDLMYAAGCRKVFLGIESGSRRVRELAGKELRCNDIERLIGECASRFETAVSLIMGFPYETLEDFTETVLLAIYSTSKGALPQMAILSPLPQAPLTTARGHPIEFDPHLVSGMVFSEYTASARETTLAALTPEACDLIRSDSQIFSAFYHFKEGRIREKLELAGRYGLALRQRL